MRKGGHISGCPFLCPGMGGILRMQEQFEGYVQDERYDAVPGMAKSGVVQDDSAYLSLALKNMFFT